LEADIVPNIILAVQSFRSVVLNFHPKLKTCFKFFERRSFSKLTFKCHETVNKSYFDELKSWDILTALLEVSKATEQGHQSS